MNIDTWLEQLKQTNPLAWAEWDKAERVQTNIDCKEFIYPMDTIEYIINKKNAINQGGVWLEKARCKLTDQQARVYKLCLVDGKTHLEASKILKISRPVVTKHLIAIAKKFNKMA